MKSTVLVVTLIFGLLVAGCGGKDAGETAKTEKVPEAPVVEPKSIADFVPNRPGTEWEYYNGVNELPTAAKRTLQRVSKTPQPANTVRYDSEIPGTGRTATEVFKYDANTLYVVAVGEDGSALRDLSPPKPVFRFPPKQDEVWEWKGTGPTVMGTALHKSRFRVDTGLTATILAGKFRVVAVTEESEILEGPMKGIRIKSITLYSPGYGVVKATQAIARPDGRQARAITELKRTTLFVPPQKPASGG